MTSVSRTGMVALLFLSLFLTPLLAHAQHQYDNWYFGINAGMRFSNNTVVSLTDGKLNTLEGCSAISSAKTGELKFYTDGVTVWDRTHATMQNGTGLLGHWTSAQSAVIVPVPGDTNRYYIFTAGAGAYHTATNNNNGVRYSIVDMQLNGSKGGVTTKNVELIARGKATEMLNATRHCNGVDYWIVSHELESNRFMTYLLTNQGITDTVISSLGMVRSGNAGTQSMARFSPNGRMIAVATPGDRALELYDFDNATGVISNARAIATDYNYYSPEFSPDNTRLYSSTLANNSDPNYLYQFNLLAGDATAIRQSRVILHTEQGSWDGGQCQLGPDGKIYVSYIDRNAVGVVNNPNSLGTAASYNHNGVSLARGTTQYGLPNCISSDIYGTSVASYTLDLKTNRDSAQYGDAVAVSVIICNTSSSVIDKLSVTITLPAGLIPMGQNNSPYTVTNLQGGACDTIQLIATRESQSITQAKVDICSDALTNSSGQCTVPVAHSACKQVTLYNRPVDTAEGDYTVYLLSACPGVSELQEVLFHSRRYTDTINAVTFEGTDGADFEYGGSLPVHYVIHPTVDQYLPVIVHRRQPGIMTAIMVVKTVTGDVFRIKIITETKSAMSPIFDVAEIRTGARTDNFDTCVTLTNISTSTGVITDTLWTHGASRRARITSPLPIRVAPGQSIQLCLRIEGSGSQLQETVMLSGQEAVSFCPHCMTHTLIINSLPKAEISGVATPGTNETSSGIQWRIYPNPVSEQLTLEFTSPQMSMVTLELIDMTGHIIRSLSDQRISTGKESISLDLQSYPTGTYWVRISSGSSTEYHSIQIVH